jgi:hypothetical protein
MNTSSWCTQIYSSIEDNSSWKTSIFFPTSLFSIYKIMGISPDLVSDCTRNMNENNDATNTETDIEMEVARTTEIDIEVDDDSHSPIGHRDNTNTETDVETEVARTTDVDTEVDVDNHIIIDSRHSVSHSSNTSLPMHVKFLKPNAKPDIDILLFLNPSLILKCQIDYIWKKHNYPENTCFLFEGYKGFSDKDKLISHIRSQAVKDGTFLFVQSRKKDQYNNTQYSVIFSCQHAGQKRKPQKSNIASNSSSLSFTDGKLQADGTTIMRAHDVPSVRNRSRCAVYKRTKHNNDEINVQNSKKIKLNLKNVVVHLHLQ